MSLRFFSLFLKLKRKLNAGGFLVRLQHDKLTNSICTDFVPLIVQLNQIQFMFHFDYLFISFLIIFAAYS